MDENDRETVTILVEQSRVRGRCCRRHVRGCQRRTRWLHERLHRCVPHQDRVSLRCRLPSCRGGAAECRPCRDTDRRSTHARRNDRQHREAPDPRAWHTAGRRAVSRRASRSGPQVGRPRRTVPFARYARGKRRARRAKPGYREIGTPTGSPQWRLTSLITSPARTGFVRATSIPISRTGSDAAPVITIVGMRIND